MFNLKEPVKGPRKAETAPKSIFSNQDVFPAIFLPFAVIVLALLLGVAYSPLFTGRWVNDVASVGEKRENVIPIKRVRWDPSKSVLDYIDQHPDEPVIFENTQVEEWRARRAWKPSYMKRILESEKLILKGAYVHDRPIFGPYFDASKPMNLEGVREKIKRVNEHRLWSPSANQFFEALFENPSTSGAWNYFAAKMQTMPSSLWLDIQPFDKILDLDPTSHEENMNLWIGQQGVSAAAHYDGYDNINVQLYGRKQWNLYAPNNQSQMYLFPFLHFHHAQTQVDVENPDHDAYPLFKDALRYEGITSPGDALYLPAMWFHNVLTLDTAINVNSWIKTPTSALLETISSQLPNDLSTQAAQLYIRLLLSFLQKQSDFVRQSLVAPRYQPLFDTNQLDTNGGVADILKQCLQTRKNPGKNSSSNSSKNDRRKERSTSKTDSSIELDGYQNISDEEARKIRILAKEHAMKLKSVPRDTLDIWLGNHVEYVLAFATQDPILVGGILQNCF